LDYEIPCPVFGLKKLKGRSDEMIVAELEREASDVIGPWNRKEYNSLVEVCGRNIRVNRCLTEMRVSYELHPVPPGIVKRGCGPGNVGFEIVPKKSKGKIKAEGV